MVESEIEKKIIISLGRATSCVWHCKVRFVVFSWIWVAINDPENWTEIWMKFWNEKAMDILALKRWFLHIDTWIISAMPFISRAITLGKFSHHPVHAILSKLLWKTRLKSRKQIMKSSKAIFSHMSKNTFKCGTNRKRI